MARNKKFVLLLIPLVAITCFSSTVLIINAAEEKRNDNLESNLPSFYFTNDYFHSNKYTDVESITPVGNEYEITQDDNLFATTSTGKYYVNKETLALKYQDNNGYIHNTTVNQYDADNKRLLNKTNYGIACSAINVFYYDFGNNNMTLQQESMQTNKDSKLVSFENLDDGFKARYYFGLSGIELDMIVKVDNNAFSVTVPGDSIVEHYKNYTENEKIDYRLGAISVYSYFGGANSDTIPGYNFIPDGTGALIRYNHTDNDNYNDYRKNIYDTDLAKDTKGLQSASVAIISMPVFGYVHGVDQHGCVAIIESGAENGSIIGTKSTSNFPFYRVYPEFFYRNSYTQPMSSSGASILQIQNERDNFDIKIRYEFLENDDANYVGMAKAYKKYLINKNALNKSNINSTDIPLRVDTIGLEVAKGAMFNKKIVMTKYDEYDEMIKEIKDSGINNVFGVYKGYTKDGTTWAAPNYTNLTSKIGNIKNFDNIDNTYFYVEPTIAHTKQTKYTKGANIAKKISSQLMNLTRYGQSYYYLNSKATKDILTKTSAKLSKKGINNLAIDSMGSRAYSSFGKDRITRQESINNYKEAINGISGNIAMFNVNDYMLDSITRNLDYSMYSSQYLAFSDTVPFSSIVLSGNIELYSNYLNFFSSVRDDLLRMVDFDVYPSFLLTKRAPSLLDETALNYIYSSKYEDYKDAIDVYYNFVNCALKNVIGSSIIKRTILTRGVSMITYDNGVSIIVNYLNHDYNHEGKTIKAKNYLVMNGGGL